jgi:hypothetical protein
MFSGYKREGVVEVGFRTFFDGTPRLSNPAPSRHSHDTNFSSLFWLISKLSPSKKFIGVVLRNRFCSVVVITPDSDSGNPGSSPGKTFRSLSMLEGHNLLLFAFAVRVSLQGSMRLFWSPLRASI